MFYMGIDWSDDHFDISIQDEQGKVRTSFTVKKRAEDFLLLLEKVRQLESDPKQVLVAIETPHSPLIEFLLNHGYAIYPIAPKGASRYRERYKMSGAVSDQQDSVILANIIRTDRQFFRPLEPDSELARELKILVADQQGLIRTRTRILNQLTATLKEYYLVALDFFDDFSAPTARAFLRKYPTTDKAGKLKAEDISKFLHKHKAYNPKTAERIHRALGQPQIQVHPLYVRTGQRKLLALLDQLEPIINQIQDYDQEIERLFRKHTDSEIFLILPNTKPVMAARLLVHFGDNRQRYSNYNQVQSYSGSAPVTKSSGNTKVVFFRWACNKHFRNALYQYSFISLQSCTWAQAYYKAKRKEGKTHAHALRCLSNIWAKIIFAIWKNRKPYDENYFLAQKMKHALQQTA